MNVKYDFSGKTVLVVGGADGMGRATSELLGESGANVMIADFDETKGKVTVADLQEKGYKAEFVLVDVRKKEDVFNAVDKTVETFGRLDYAANVVGIAGKIDETLFFDREDSLYDNVMDTNVRGHWWLLQAETKQMLKQGGEGYSIVEVTSMQGFVAAPHAEAYTVSKHAAVGLVKAAGADFAKSGIRVNGIAPVATATSFAKNAVKQMGMEFSNRTDRVPRGTMLEPEECANAIVWLLSDGSTGLNATTIAVDGGALSIK